MFKTEPRTYSKHGKPYSEQSMIRKELKRKFKNAKAIGHFGLAFEENSGTEIT